MTLSLGDLYEQAPDRNDVAAEIGRLAAPQLGLLVRTPKDQLDSCGWELGPIAVWRENHASTEDFNVALGFRDLIEAAYAQDEGSTREWLDAVRHPKRARRLDSQGRRLRHRSEQALPDDIDLLAGEALGDHREVFEPLWLSAANRGHQLCSILQGDNWCTTQLNQTDAATSVQLKAQNIKDTCATGAEALQKLGESVITYLRHADAHGDWAFDHGQGTVSHLDSAGKAGTQTSASATELARAARAAAARAVASDAAVLAARVDLHMDCDEAVIRARVSDAFLAEAHLPLEELTVKKGVLLLLTANAAYAQLGAAPRIARQILACVSGVSRVRILVEAADGLTCCGDTEGA